MTKVYLINDMLLFEPEMRRIGPLAGYPERSVSLHGPVSECLLQLLEHNTQVLTQRFLFSVVWERQGAVVTTNALYQTIASIRKALKTAGLADDIIKTLPKEGFESVASLRVGDRDEFLMPHDPPSVAVVTEKIADIIEPCAQTPVVKQRSSIAYWLAGAMFIFCCGVFFMTLNDDASVFTNYHKMGNIGGCEVYSSWQDIDKSRSTFDALSLRYPVTCKPGMVAYLTLNHAQHGISVITCDRNPKDGEANCNSIFYRQQYHEDK
ncbi:winged helix-turn-helix domain-containing protein [Lelliottia sp. RWM.1]|uniref:winged helix-turn-helix domain-containing protein n=1 Tax=Lelliottia sp. RWM.1 TaxID=2663242 RepID=UPI00193DF63A|nr:winged helix-turn-helix domain-containing protein [Lelliottia sp. RWM.1]MBM3069794.1 hypothetical protein [Lelliottia sp. RWM.1]